MNVRLGYACINTELREQGIFSSRGMILKTLTDATKGGVELARKLAIANIQDTKLILQWNEQNGIRFFRLTSELFPHINNHLAGSAILEYKIDFAKPYLQELGALSRRHGHRITAHPGQFVQLGTPKEDVLQRSILDLTTHADIFLAMGLTPQLGSVMVVHGGGVYGDKSETLARWCKNYQALPEHVRQFVVLENDEYGYGVLDLLPWCEKYDIPLVIDWFHNICFKKIHEAKNDGTNVGFGPHSTDIIERIVAIWRRRGIKPKCHYSEQADGMRVGTHSDFISELPADILGVCAKYDIDIMCECKQKQACMLPLLTRHFDKHVSTVHGNDYVYYSIKPQYIKK
jgi:UV DNA damage endonuclease